MNLSKTLVLAALLLNPVFAMASTGAIEERGTERRITLELSEKSATFRLFDGNTETDRVEIGQTDRSALAMQKNIRTQMLTDGDQESTYLLAARADMMSIVLLSISSVVSGVSYLYTLPVDLFSKENNAHRKMNKLIAGENVKASKKTFGHMVEKLFH